MKIYTYKIGDEGVESTTSNLLINLGLVGETITVDNPLITDITRASLLGAWIGTHLGHRMTLDSSWRADVRLDPLDIITSENDYLNNKVRMTEVNYKFNGAFRSAGKGKVI